MSEITNVAAEKDSFEESSPLSEVIIVPVRDSFIVMLISI